MNEKPPTSYLMSHHGDDGERYYLDDYNTIGRHPQNNIQILDRMISKVHAIITFQNGEFVVYDQKSRNGSYINGQRIHQGVLHSGDILQLGTVQFSFVMETARFKPVTIADQVISAKIASINQAEANKNFLPADQITDERQLRKDYEKLRVAHSLNQRIRLEVNMDELFDQILEECFNLVNADRGTILIRDESGELQTRSFRSRDPNTSIEDISISRTILNSVLEEKTAMLSSDAKIDDRLKRSESIIMQNIQAAMCVPLLSRSGNEVLGVLHLDSQQHIGAFTEKDLQITSVIASQAAGALENVLLVQQNEKESLIRANLQRFLSPAVMNRLNRDELQIRMGGETVDTTMMFTDIRGFTSLSENYNPEQLIQDLNRYFEVCVDMIFEHEGTLDKYIGDAIMAVWGTVEQHQEDPVRAVRAAMLMQQKLEHFNKVRVEEELPPFLTGIGINTGPVVAGNMGSPKRLEFTVIGDEVNIAARLCSEAKGGEVIISHSTFMRVGHEFVCRELPPASVKGKSEPLRIYRVEGFRELSDIDNDATFI